MTDQTEKRSRGWSPKPLPKIDASPDRVARAMFSTVKKPDLSIRLPKTHTQKPAPTQSH